MKTYQFTAHIERDEETELYIGYIPSIPGAHTQATTMDELNENLKEVLALCLAELSAQELFELQSHFVGTQEVRVTL